MSKIELPYIHAKSLMKRWNIDLDSLITQCIFDLGLPVYDRSYKKQEIAEPKEIDYPDGPINGASGYLQYKNTLSELFFGVYYAPFWPDIGAQTESEILSDFYFKMEDVKNFEEKYGKKDDLTIRGKDTEETSDQDISSVQNETTVDPEDFIRNLRVYYENDSEVKVQEPNRKGKIHNHDSLGFSSNKTLEWKAFINVLQEPPHIYETGQAFEYLGERGKRKRIPGYDSKHQRLRAINKKLIYFFNKNYSPQIPEGFKLFERCEKEGTGKYKFKFQVEYDWGTEKDFISKYERYPEDKLINEIERLAQKYHINKESVDYEVFLRSIDGEKFKDAVTVANKKGWVEAKDIKDMLKPDT